MGSRYLDRVGRGQSFLDRLRAGVQDNVTPLPTMGLDELWAFLPTHEYIHAPSGRLLPARSIDTHLPHVGEGNDRVKPSVWLDRTKAIIEMTWDPGETQIIDGRIASNGGWIHKPGCRTFNLYRPPVPLAGQADKATMWRDYLRAIYPDDADHIEQWLASRVQRPGVKINHALVLGGEQGIGKDSLLEPAKSAVGPWNWAETTPQEVMGKFSGYVRAVIIRINEAHDLGEFDRFQFYDRSKTLIAAPPDVLMANEKYMRPYPVANCCGVIITSNHMTDGLYLPAGDRRHYVAWSTANPADIDAAGWRAYWQWLEREGRGHVAAFLRGLDLSSFDAKAPPPKTEAWHTIVSVGISSEQSDLEELIDLLGRPAAITIGMLAESAEGRGIMDVARDLLDRAQSRKLPHRMDRAGYEVIRNPAAKAGRWKVGGRDMAIYARKGLTQRDKLDAAEALCSRYRGAR